MEEAFLAIVGRYHLGEDQAPGAAVAPGGSSVAGGSAPIPIFVQCFEPGPLRELRRLGSRLPQIFLLDDDPPPRLDDAALDEIAGFANGIGPSKVLIERGFSVTGSDLKRSRAATMLEAIRILQAIGVTPRRTIRVALWSGEEQGLLGSQAYVKEHFGTFEAQKPEHSTFAGYFNIDSGTGRARGMTVFGPPDAATVLREATRPFADNGFFGATSTTSRRRGGSASRCSAPTCWRRRIRRSARSGSRLGIRSRACRTAIASRRRSRRRSSRSSSTRC